MEEVANQATIQLNLEVNPCVIMYSIVTNSINLIGLVGRDTI